ncbi:MAG: RnfABCDGE type electron transport complex subunit D [Candidatus Hadarchaeales archaeon]
MNKLVVSPSPHIKDSITVEEIMYSVIIALVPAVVAGAYFFGIEILAMIAVSILTAVVTEYVAMRLMKRKFRNDGSAILTGLLLALTLPPTVPLWIPAVGAFFAIAIVKCAFGGLGHNIFNPALAGRIFLALSWPSLMRKWPEWVGPDGITTATPLQLWKFQNTLTPYFKLFIGNVGGCIGETSALALLIGGLFLISRKYIDWKIPVSFIGTVGLLMFLLGQDPIFHILAGGLFLGAFFMATDYVTTPLTGKGRVIFGVGAGILVVIFRMYSGMTEGVAFSILIMNAFTPLIDKVIKPKVYGTTKVKT